MTFAIVREGLPPTRFGFTSRCSGSASLLPGPALGPRFQSAHVDPAVTILVLTCTRVRCARLSIRRSQRLSPQSPTPYTGDAGLSLIELPRFENRASVIPFPRSIVSAACRTFVHRPEQLSALADSPAMEIDARRATFNNGIAWFI
jgi:hypothetical protein